MVVIFAVSTCVSVTIAASGVLILPKFISSLSLREA